MIYTINELRQKVFSHVFDVYEIFQNFFGERFTDLQEIPTDEDMADMLSALEIEPLEDGRYDIPGPKLRRVNATYSTLKPFILVWWPRVTVTNENDKSVQIQDLYAKVFLTIEGRIPYEYRGFKLNRTTFPENQFTSGYLHSHIPHFSGVPMFSDPCLGTGPINNTIMDLKNGYEETLWMLFCQELSLYVTVESLRGGPYFRMEQIGSEVRLSGFMDYNSSFQSFDSLSGFTTYTTASCAIFKDLLKTFTIYYLHNGHLALSYKDGRFIQGMPYFDFMVDISNCFIDFFNTYGDGESVSGLYSRGILTPAIAANNQFYSVRNRVPHDLSRYEGEPMFEFKGEMKHLHIETGHEGSREEIRLLHYKIAMFILYNLLKIINYRYKNEYNSKQLGDSSSTAVASTSQTVVYL